MATKKRGPRARAAELVTSDRKRDLRYWLKQATGNSDEKEAPHDLVFQAWKRIGRMTQARRAQDLYFASLYEDTELAVAMLGQSIGEFTPQTLATNVCRPQVDTYTARVCKNKPLPMGLTTGGSYSEQRRAKALSQFYAGILDEAKFWDTRQLRRRDSGIFGSGFALNWREGRVIHHDRFLPFEVRVDPRDGFHGRPRVIFIGRWVDRLVLQEQYPDFAEEIENADSRDEHANWTIGIDETSDVVLVLETWHLPSGSKAKDGRHVIAVSNCTLRNDEYSRQRFPISKNDFSPPVFGWFGDGLVKQLRGLQFEVNSVGLRLQEREYLMGTYVLREANSELDYESVDNGTLTEIVYSGREPKFVEPAAAHPQTLEWYSMLRNEMPAQITRQSQFSTRNQLPDGLSGSGKSQRVYLNNEEEGFAPQMHDDEQDVLDTCWQFFDLAEEIYEETGKEPSDGEETDDGPYMVQVEQREHGQTLLKDLSYADVRIDREKFTLRIFPTNFLSGTPEDKFATVKEIMDAGLLSEDEAAILLDFPDTQHVMNLRTAARRLIERLMEKLKNSRSPDRDYVYPEPAYNLDLCIALGQQNYLEGILDGVPPKNLKWMIQFAIDAADMKNGRTLQPRPDGTSAAPPMGAPPPPPMDPNAPLDGSGMPPPAMPGPGAAQEAGFAPPPTPVLPEGVAPPTAIPQLPQV